MSIETTIGNVFINAKIDIQQGYAHDIHMDMGGRGFMLVFLISP